ncbi:MAG: hypothetical protein IJ335_00435 [Lachnospiraceae bacterium]|nr:hypothetical protein [Lachnospiraceae bacterium]
MKKIRKQRLTKLVAGLLLALTLTGCGSAKLPEVVEHSSLKISSRGAVSSWLISDFEKEYYSVKELANMAAEEAIAYNLAHPMENGAEAVVMEGAELFGDGKQVRLHTSYADCDTYAAYNKEILFYGTVSEAVQQGYDFSTRVKSVSEDGEELTGTDMKLDGGKYLLITNAKANIYCPRKVTHIDEGAALNEDGSVDTTQTDALVYILMK